MAKILLVDDSETIRAQLKKDLSDGGHDVVEAADGLEGIDQLKSNGDVQLVFCDVNMPNMDGLTMCEKVASESLSSAVILMLTTESNPEMKERGKNAGVRAWITKPYNKDKVLEAVKKLVG